MPLLPAIQSHQQEFRSPRRGAIVLASTMLKKMRRPKVTRSALVPCELFRLVIVSLGWPRLTWSLTAIGLVVGRSYWSWKKTKGDHLRTSRSPRIDHTMTSSRLIQLRSGGRTGIT